MLNGFKTNLLHYPHSVLDPNPASTFVTCCVCVRETDRQIQTRPVGFLPVVLADLVLDPQDSHWLVLEKPFSVTPSIISIEASQRGAKTHILLVPHGEALISGH